MATCLPIGGRLFFPKRFEKTLGGELFHGDKHPRQRKPKHHHHHATTQLPSNRVTLSWPIRVRQRC
jgi:hypothetical protein